MLPGCEILEQIFNDQDSPVERREILYVWHDSVERLGLAVERIEPGETGYVLTFGYLRDVDTTGNAPGDVLYHDGVSQVLCIMSGQSGIIFIGPIGSALYD